MKRRKFLRSVLASGLLGYPGVPNARPAREREQPPEFETIVEDLWRVKDLCNVYILKQGDRAICFDFGGGAWINHLDRIGVQHLDHVFLTHHHADQCRGLDKAHGRTVVHAPRGEQVFLDPDERRRRLTFSRFERGCPASYSVPERGFKGLRYDIRGFDSIRWGKRTVRFIHTPGHGSNACSAVVGHKDKQIVFCGDAVCEGGSLYHPFNLEWDHWTGEGALAAWQGAGRLGDIGMDILCPSRGHVIYDDPARQVRRLSRRLMDFYNIKNSISPGENDRYTEPQEVMQNRAVKISDHLYQYGNFYLLLSGRNEALVVDPHLPQIDVLEALWRELGEPAITAAVTTHYHFDHSDGLQYLREKHGTRIYCHPVVAEPLKRVRDAYLPWLPSEPVAADRLWPNQGIWTWNEYSFAVAHAPGQTWWHCMFMATVDNIKVCFSGDSFQPNSKWNGTGGFCAYNGSRLLNGFAPTCRRILSWTPDIMAAGHASCFAYSRSKFEKIIKWAARAHKATEELCPGGDIEKHYYAMGTDPGNGGSPAVDRLKGERFGWII